MGSSASYDTVREPFPRSDLAAARSGRTFCDRRRANACRSSSPRTTCSIKHVFTSLGTVRSRLHFLGTLDSPRPQSMNLLRRRSEIAQLRVYCALECGPRGAALYIGGQSRIACDDVSVVKDSEYCRHHQITRSEAVPIEIGLDTER